MKRTHFCTKEKNVFWKITVQVDRKEVLSKSQARQTTQASRERKEVLQSLQWDKRLKRVDKEKTLNLIKSLLFPLWNLENFAWKKKTWNKIFKKNCLEKNNINSCRTCCCDHFLLCSFPIRASKLFKKWNGNKCSI